MRFVVLLVLAAACGHPSPPPAAPAAAPAAAPGASATAAAPPDCTADSALEGTPCAPEGKVCGAQAAAQSPGFSHVLHCANGKWQAVEVPPPPPPH